MTPHPDDNKILPFNAGLGHRLRVLRQTRQLSQKALADALGISFQQLQKYERGSNRLTVDRLVQVSHILGVGAEYFLDDPAQAHLPPRWAEQDCAVSGRRSDEYHGCRGAQIPLPSHPYPRQSHE